MPADDLLRIDVLSNRNFNQATPLEAKLISVKPDSTEPEWTKPDKTITPDEALFLIPLGFTMVFTIFVVMLPDVWKFARARIATINCFHQVPCKNCRFFTNNHYLWCTVHPSTALTKEALHCCDYHPRDGDS